MAQNVPPFSATACQVDETGIVPAVHEMPSGDAAHTFVPYLMAQKMELPAVMVCHIPDEGRVFGVPGDDNLNSKTGKS
jgi:hypothetical protein